LSSTQGVTVEEVRLGAARFQSPEDRDSIQQAITALEKAGFPAREVQSSAQ